LASLSHWRPLVGRGWIFHTNAEYLAGSFALPNYSLIERVIHLDSPRYRTVADTAGTEPAFFRIYHHRWLPGFLIGHKNIGATDIHTIVAPQAKIRVDNHTLIGNVRIRHNINIIIHHRFSPSSAKYLKVAIFAIIFAIGCSIRCFQPVIQG
jgi:hypothetical protein